MDTVIIDHHTNDGEGLTILAWNCHVEAIIMNSLKDVALIVAKKTPSTEVLPQPTGLTDHYPDSYS